MTTTPTCVGGSGSAPWKLRG